MSAYEYNPLSSSDDIRLLVLRAGKRRAIVECKLTHVSLSSTTVYEALSYTWGSDSNLQPILIDGYVFHVRENLASALQHLRYEDADRVFWVDALCINQSDIEERNRQVLRMGSIFQNAKLVQAWLGAADDDSDEAIALMRNINNGDWRENFLKDLSDGGAAILHQSQRWRAIAVLMERAWFRRRWVVQEVAFATAVLVNCGSMIITWQELSHAIAFLQEHGRAIWKIWQSRVESNFSNLNLHGGKGDLSAQRAARLVVASKEAIRKEETTNTMHRLYNLEALVVLFPDFNVSDLRDVIYALIPLAKDVHDSKEWLPDYSKPFQEVWEQYVSYVIRTTGSLDMICRPWVRWPTPCPSWMLYLSLQMTKPSDMIRRPRTAENLLVGRPGETNYNAAGSSRADFKISGHILFAKGFWIDTISAVSSTAADGNLDRNIPLDWRSLALKTINQRGSSAALSDLPMQSLPEEICETLVAGRAGDGEPFDASYRRACDILWGSETSQGRLESVLPALPALSENDKAITSRFLSRVRECTRHRKFATTNSRRLGLVWSGARPSDLVCILLGCSVPVILRKEGRQYVLRGESYIHGMMDGQAMRDLDLGLYALQDFAIK